MTLPNQLTVLRIILTPIAVFFLLMQEVFAKQLATGVFIIASLTDFWRPKEMCGLRLHEWMSRRPCAKIR